MLKCTFLNKDEDNKLYEDRYFANGPTDFDIPTDYALLCGCRVESQKAWYWTKSLYPNDNDFIYCNSPNFARLSPCSLQDKKDVGIKPVIKFDSIMDFPINLVNKKDNKGNRIIEFGYYPKSVVSNEISEILNDGVDVIEHDDIFIDKNKINSDNTLIPYSSSKCTIYEYNGKLYTRIKSDVFKHRLSFAREVILSDGKYHKNGEVLWIEIEPIEWLLFEDSKMLVAKNIVLSGLPFDIIKKYKYDKSIEGTSKLNELFDNTFIGKYMNNTFLNNIIELNNLALKVKKSNTSLSREEVIYNLVEEIKLLTCNYYDKENVLNIVSRLIEKYNKSIDNISKESNNGMILHTKSPNMLYKELLEGLKDLANNVRKDICSKKEYLDMLIILSSSLSIISSNNIDINNDDLLKDILLIKERLFTNIDDEQKNRFRNIFINIEKDIIDYLYNNKKLDYRNIKEFKIYIRKKIQEYLLSIKIDIDNDNIKKDFMISLNNILNNVYTESKNKYINIYMNEIKKMSEEIKRTGTEEDKEQLYKLISNSAKDGATIDITITLFKDIYKLLLEIRERKEKDIEGYRIDIKI